MTREEADVWHAIEYRSYTKGCSFSVRDSALVQLLAEIRADERERIAEELDLIGATFETEKPDTSRPGTMIVEYRDAADFVRGLGK